MYPKNLNRITNDTLAWETKLLRLLTRSPSESNTEPSAAIHTFLILNFLLDILDGVAGLDLKGNRLTREGLNEYLHDGTLPVDNLTTKRPKFCKLQRKTTLFGAGYFTSSRSGTACRVCTAAYCLAQVTQQRLAAWIGLQPALPYSCGRLNMVY